MLMHWTITLLGNLAGSLFLVAIIFGCRLLPEADVDGSKTNVRTSDGGVFDSSPYREEVVSFVTKKQLTPTWGMIFLRGIGANWLVCLACFLGMQGRELVSKIIGIWWPIFAFVSLSLDHVVANMFFVPMGIWLGTPELSVGLYIYKGIIPAGLGNIVGGALFCGGFYWYMYLLDAEPVAIDGELYQPTEGNLLLVRRRAGDEESGGSTEGVKVGGGLGM